MIESEAISFLISHSPEVIRAIMLGGQSMFAASTVEHSRPNPLDAQRVGPAVAGGVHQADHLDVGLRQ